MNKIKLLSMLIILLSVFGIFGCLPEEFEKEKENVNEIAHLPGSGGIIIKDPVIKDPVIKDLPVIETGYIFQKEVIRNEEGYSKYSKYVPQNPILPTYIGRYIKVYQPENMIELTNEKILLIRFFKNSEEINRCKYDLTYNHTTGFEIIFEDVIDDADYINEGLFLNDRGNQVNFGQNQQMDPEWVEELFKFALVVADVFMEAYALGDYEVISTDSGDTITITTDDFYVIASLNNVFGITIFSNITGDDNLLTITLEKGGVYTAYTSDNPNNRIQFYTVGNVIKYRYSEDGGKTWSEWRIKLKVVMAI